MAAKHANTKIVKQKKRGKKHETEEVESVIESGSELSTESTVKSSKSGSKKRLSSTESGDISSSTSSDSDDSDSSDEPKKKKRKRNRSKKNRQKKEKKRKSSERQKEHEIITGIEPTESVVAVVEPPSASPVKTSAGGEEKVVKPLVVQGEPPIYGNIATASFEQLQYEMARRIQQQKEITDTVMVDPILAGENEK